MKAWFIDRLAQLLPIDEREAVLGDLAERASTELDALRDVAGLVMRRQAALWREPRLWNAVWFFLPLGLALNWQSFLTSGTSATTLWLYLNNWDWGLLGLSAFRQLFPVYVARVLGDFLVLACWSWACGFAVAAWSRRTLPVNGMLLLLVLTTGGIATLLIPHVHDPVFQVWFYRAILPPAVQLVLVLVPAILGMRQGARSWRSSGFKRAALWIAAFLSSAWMLASAASPMLRLSLGHSYFAQFVYLACYWPVIYWIFEARGISKEKRV